MHQARTWEVVEGVVSVEGAWALVVAAWVAAWALVVAAGVKEAAGAMAAAGVALAALVGWEEEAGSSWYQGRREP